MALTPINNHIQGYTPSKRIVANQSVSQERVTAVVVGSQPNHTFNHSPQGEQLAESLYQQTIYDQPSPKVNKAISTYKQYAFLERREEVQTLLSVSVYV